MKNTKKNSSFINKSKLAESNKNIRNRHTLGIVSLVIENTKYKRLFLLFNYKRHFLYSNF